MPNLNLTSTLRGEVTDGNGFVVGRIDGIDQARQMVLVQRINLFDDLLRAVMMLRHQAGVLPPMMEMDVAGTVEEANKCR